MARTSQQLTPLSTLHALHVFRCEVSGEAALALAHGREAVDYAWCTEGSLPSRSARSSHLRELIQERAGGNPFFIEEIVQSLVEAGVVTGTRGAYRLVG